jgi:hypothetical protein
VRQAPWGAAGGTKLPAVPLAMFEKSENPPSFFARTRYQYVVSLVTEPS